VDEGSIDPQPLVRDAPGLQFLKHDSGAVKAPALDPHERESLTDQVVQMHLELTDFQK
jgi:hypothetical protein